MSGEKHVTISTSEFERLRADESRLRSLREDLPELIDAARRDASAEMQRRIGPLEERQKAFRQALRELSGEISRQEEETARRLEQQQKQARRELNDAILSVRGETRQLIQEQDRRLTSLIEAERDARRCEIEKVQSQLGRLLANEKHAEERAQSWIKNAETMRAFIEGHYRHQEFAPGELDRLSRVLRQASQNLADRVPQAAISGAQSAYHDLSDLRLKLERMESEWEACWGVALANAEKVLAEAQANRKCRALDLQAKDTGIDVEVDYWTEGKLSLLEKKAAELVQRLKSRQPGLSTAQLRELAEKEFPGMRSELEQLIEEARIRVIASQMRANVADLVVQSLESKGYQVTEHAYEGEDLRGGFVAKLASLDNSEIVILVSPDENDPGKNNLQIHSFDDGAFPAERTARAKEIGEVLGAAGLDVGSVHEIAPQPDPAVRDVKGLRRRPLKSKQAQSKPESAKGSSSWNA